MAVPLGGRASVRNRHRRLEAEDLHPRHVPLSVGCRASRRPLRGLHRHRRPRSLQAGERIPGSPPDGLGCLRSPGRALRRAHRHSPGEDDRGGDRQLQTADPRARVLLRLVTRDRHHRSRLLPLDAVDLPEALRARPRLRRRGADQLVSERPHRARQRRGEAGALRTLRYARREAKSSPVDAAHHGVRRPLAGRPRWIGLARGHAHHAARMDRPERGRRHHLPRGRGLARGRRGDHRVHHAPRHALRRDLRGPRP